MNKYSFCLFFLTLIGCNIDKKDTPTVFAGQIINPTSETVILYKDDIAIDSARLDTQNRFSITLKNIDEGLYNFRHAPQYQYVYLSKGDSLLIRLNTIYFDESLVFSGKGEEINNFLVEIFLTGEDEESLINSYYKLEPIAFSKKIDSLRELKIKLLEELNSENNLSKKSLEIANASIDYNTYITKEKYPFKNYKKTKQNSFSKIDDDFYAYRKDLNFNNKDLTYFTPYYDFMKRHFDNLAFADCTDDCKNGEMAIKNQLHFNSHKLELIDSIVKEKDLRDNLFRNVAMSYFLKVHDNPENNKLFLDEFNKLSENNKHSDEIHDLYDGVVNMQPNKQIPDVNVLDSVGNVISLKDITEQNKDVVFYFWTSKNKRHFSHITKQVSKLSDANPDLKFVGISLTQEQQEWQTMVKSFNKNFENQYQAEDIDKLRRTLIIDGLNKAILIKDGLILDAYKDMYSRF